MTNKSSDDSASQSIVQGINIHTLRRKRGHVIGQINTFAKFLDSCERLETRNIPLIETHLNGLQDIWKRFDEIQFDIEELDDSEIQRRYEIQNHYYEVITRAKVMIDRTPASVSIRRNRSDSNTPSGLTPIAIKLPQMRLPTFDGSIEKWSSFFDIFTSVIHNNEDLSAVQKLQYLRSTLTGQAAASIESLSTTEANYATAIELLKEKYDNTRKILLRHCNAIREYPKLAKDTPEAIGKLVDTIQQHLRSLQNLGENIDAWDSMLNSIILSKIGSDTAWHWELSLKDKKMPSCKILLEFLEKRADCGQSPSLKSNFTTERQIENRNFKNRPQRNQVFVTGKIQSSEQNPKHVYNESASTFVKPSTCPICNEQHSIWSCETFHNQSVKDRITTVKKSALCTNCLRKGHLPESCRGGSCRICSKRHHTLLHNPEQSKGNFRDKTATTNLIPNFIINSITNELLVTAQVNILNNNNQSICCRALIDTCATTNFITESLAKKLEIPSQRCSISVGVLNSISTVSKHTITATIQSKNSDYQRSLTFLTIPSITSFIPDQPINREMIRIPKNLRLADPDFHKPAPVDLLLGAGVALSLLCVGQINLSLPKDPDLYLQKTRLGWVIGGSVPTSITSKNAFCNATNTLPLDLTRFWEIEEVSKDSPRTYSDELCENHFRTHVTRNDEGRYVVALPFNEQSSRLGESKTQALKRFMSLERKLSRDALLNQEYRRVMQEYLDFGHMSEASDILNDGYYLPHHGVIKVTSQTTKLRVVFDASATTTSGISLNDALYIGPKIQDDLIYVLLRFRCHKFVITGDIEKMYRQFLVRPEDRRFQRILWRDDSGQLKTYELNTVTFGLSAAPFLAIRCLKQLALDEGHNYPHASQILLRDFYVDDVLTGASTIQETIQLRNGLSNLLKSAGLNIRQWASNDKQLLQGLPEQDINKNLHLGESSVLKTLGVIWNSVDDSITYKIKTSMSPLTVTKRSISSEIAKIYDPLGLLGPVIIVAKILLQKLWTLKVDWDESLPMDIHTEWMQFYTQLPLLNNTVFQRRALDTSSNHIEIHGFCDASNKAYGACVYLRYINASCHASVELLLAKSKVAPLKTQTIPRLELCGALLLSNLITIVKDALNIKVNRTILWTDSMIVLHWINTSPHILKTFVANRISEIQCKTQDSNWRYVPTKDNPADHISRGQSPKEFLRPSTWHHGPDWLKQDESFWPINTLSSLNNIPERKAAICLTTTSVVTSLLDNYSSWGKMQRVVAFCFRWKRNNINKGSLSAAELKEAHDVLIKLMQRLHFADELRCLTKDSNSVIKGKLQRLNPFIDKNGILRVGGRLEHSFLPFAQKHPIIVPKCRATALIIENEHRGHLHAGVQATLYAVRRRYWPIDGRSQVWKAIKDCVRCCRANPPPVDYIMGNLPEARIIEARPFTNVGVDYCGPFFIKERRYKNRTRVKVYVAVFVCFAVKAIHLELVSDLTSEAFIAALRRFIARRGFCANLYSDNGTNFVGANNDLMELRKLLRSDDHHDKVKSFLAERNIQWHFIPPLSPHFGGLWEAAVKSFKYHLKRVAGIELFTFEDFNTLIIEIESILNSRPLTPIPSDPNDLLALTPGHFLIGDTLTSLRERDFSDTPSNRLSNWQHIQKLKQHFWIRWHKEYLNELNSRSKWTSGTHPIKEGTIVLLREDNTPSMQWPLGRVIKVQPGSDGIIRAVTVKTATNTLDRNVKRLVPLFRYIYTCANNFDAYIYSRLIYIFTFNHTILQFYILIFLIFIFITVNKLIKLVVYSVLIGPSQRGEYVQRRVAMRAHGEMRHSLHFKEFPEFGIVIVVPPNFGIVQQLDQRVYYFGENRPAVSQLVVNSFEKVLSGTGGSIDHLPILALKPCRNRDFPHLFSTNGGCDNHPHQTQRSFLGKTEREDQEISF
ncbi:uncharacterized protein LOC143187438 [Calliopsis andreniformis]|uniref:uncharacterized protein LOC143187438 n=1 Tax=Calliopsis andreniformis TaxID=337506 RepID=UPI003FCE4926